MGITFKMSISVSKKRQWITRSGITGKLWVSMQDTWFVCDAAIHTVRPPKLSRWRADREKAWKTSSKHLHHMLRERRAIDSLNRVPELRCLIKLFLQNSVYYLCIVHIIFGSTIWKPNRNVANGRKSRRGGLKKKKRGETDGQGNARFDSCHSFSLNQQAWPQHGQQRALSISRRLSFVAMEASGSICRIRREATLEFKNK